MASKYTSGYRLSQWEAGDKVLRTDFNEDNAKLDAALRRHDGQLLGVPALGRNLYNFFLRQKNAGQDVSWMEGLVYDDFSDQSKIESMGEGMNWSPTEKCVHFTPVNGELSGPLVTVVHQLGLSYSRAFLWARYSLSMPLVVEFYDRGRDKWYPFEIARQSTYWSMNLKGEKAAEGVYYIPTNVSGSSFQLRLTLKAINDPDLLPVKLYDYGCMLI